LEFFLLKEPKVIERKWPPGIWRIATTTSLRRSLIVMACLLLSGLLEAVGIASLLPLIALSQPDGASSKMGQSVINVLDTVGLPHEPTMLLVLLAVGMLGKAVVLLFAMRNVGYAVAEVGTKMRLRLVESLLAARWGFFVRQPIGRFANALGLESTRAGEAYNATAEFVAHSIQSIVYIGVVALVSWEAALGSLVLGLFMVVSLNRLLISTKRNAKKQTRRMKSLVGRLADVLIGLKPTKAMARQGRFGVLFVRDVQKIDVAMRRHIFARHANRVLQEPMIAIFLGIGIYLALNVWHVDLLRLVMICVLVAKTVSTIGKAQQDLQAVNVAESGYWAVQDAIDEAVEARELVDGGLAPTFERDVELRNVSMSFGRKRVIIDANCTIPRGGVTAITGHSGAGKTTLVDIMLGLYRPDIGDIRIDGQSLSELDVMKWRSMVGYVPQELILFHDTIMTNVTLGETAYTRQDVENALRQAGAWDFVAALPEGIDHVVGERGALLSGGQRQRIAMARALVHKPKLLILDEATSALDPHTEAMIVRNVCDLAHSTGLTVLAITHQPAWVAAADKVIRIQDGVVSEIEPSPQRVSAQ